MPPDARMVRPLPPDHLNDECAREWEKIVNAMPPGWFPPETHALLTQYAHHIVRARRVGQLLEDIERGKGTLDIDLYDRAAKMMERESRCLASLATRMRISQQALFDRTKPKGKFSGAAKPWKVVDVPPSGPRGSGEF
jgi:hypothetical protein